MIRDGDNIKYLWVMSAGTLSAGRFIEFVPGNNSNDRCTLQQKFRDDSFIGDYSRSNIRASLMFQKGLLYYQRKMLSNKPAFESAVSLNVLCWDGFGDPRLI